MRAVVFAMVRSGQGQKMMIGFPRGGQNPFDALIEEDDEDENASDSEDLEAFFSLEACC